MPLPVGLLRLATLSSIAVQTHPFLQAVHQVHVAAAAQLQHLLLDHAFHCPAVL